MGEIQLLLVWARSVLTAERGRAERTGGASIVEWVLICVLVATAAAVLSIVLIRWVVSTTNTVRTR